MFRQLLEQIALRLDARGIPDMVIGGQAVLSLPHSFDDQDLEGPGSLCRLSPAKPSRK